MRLPFLNALANGKITILLFHKVPAKRHPLSPGELDVVGFEQVLDAVMENFRILPLSDAVHALGRGILPSRTACITFDDGYPEWVTEVAPALEQRNAHATFFVTSGQLDGLPLWNERILYAVDALPTELLLDMTEFGLPILPMKTLHDRQMAIRWLDSTIKYLSPERKEKALQVLEANASVSSIVPRMTAHELRGLHSKGFAIGAHSITHPILAKCGDDLAYQEIAGSREMLEGIVGAPVQMFAYPNGTPGKDFGPRHVAMVRKAGYSTAFSTNSGVATNATSHFQIPRFTPWGPSSIKMGLQLARNLLQDPRAVEEERESAKALMVAFHFPPQAGSSGVQRTINFAKHMHAADWRPVIVSANPRAYESVSEDLLNSIPIGMQVRRALALDAARHFSFKGKYLGIMALPDRWSTWWFGAVVAALYEIQKGKPDVLWSTYPIATAHLIGATLQWLTRIPWIADFRDPMLVESYPVGKMHRSVWSKIEEITVRYASRCTFTTQRTLDLYAQKYPTHRHKFAVIPNGYDEEAFENNPPMREGVRPNQKLLLHSGVIYPSERNPKPFFIALSAILKNDTNSRENLVIRFRAPKHGDEILSAAREAGVEQLIEIMPPISYKDAIAEMQGADVLLLFQGDGFDTQIPAKLYEYLRTGRPILAMTGESGDTRKLLKGVNRAKCARIDVPADIQFKLQGCLDELVQANPVMDERELIWLNRFSREHGAKQLMELVDQLHAK